VQSESAIILLRSRLLTVAQRLGFSELRRENMALVTAELVTNQIKHAGGKGQIQVWQQPGPVLDVFALDYGPGIANLALAQQDGYSSVNTLGKGLGSIQRLSDEVHVFTQPAVPGPHSRWNGSAFLVRFHPRGGQDATTGMRLGLFARALADERYNGDRIYVAHDEKAIRWLHLDGLGHGENAQKCTANLAVHLGNDASPEQIIAAVDRQLRTTRGAVGVAGEIRLPAGQVELLGVGDMHAHFVERDAEMQNLAFAPGVLGHEHKRARAIHATMGVHGRVISASDGIRRNWDAGNFQGLFAHHPQLIAYVLGNIMGRLSDDQSLCVVGLD
jgi:anti-sigma regulatory factor (Ser/Thr protein kinase)